MSPLSLATNSLRENNRPLSDMFFFWGGGEGGGRWAGFCIGFPCSNRCLIHLKKYATEKGVFRKLCIWLLHQQKVTNHFKTNTAYTQVSDLTDWSFKQKSVSLSCPLWAPVYYIIFCVPGRTKHSPASWVPIHPWVCWWMVLGVYSLPRGRMECWYWGKSTEELIKRTNLNVCWKKAFIIQLVFWKRFNVYNTERSSFSFYCMPKRKAYPSTDDFRLNVAQ